MDVVRGADEVNGPPELIWRPVPFMPSVIEYLLIREVVNQHALDFHRLSGQLSR